MAIDGKVEEGPHPEVQAMESGDGVVVKGGNVFL